MGLLNFIFGSSPKPQLPPVPAADTSKFSASEKQFIEEVNSALSTNKAFKKSFTRDDGTQVKIDFTGKRLTVNLYPNDGTRLEFAAIDTYMGQKQWGGGINTYNPDGSFGNAGVFPRKFNSAQDLFNFIVSGFEKEVKDLKEKPSTQLSQEQLTELHKPVSETDLEVLQELSLAQVKNPKAFAQEGETLTFATQDNKEYQVTHKQGYKVNGNGIEIILSNNNANHLDFITRIDEIEKKLRQKYAPKVSLMGKKVPAIVPSKNSIASVATAA